MCGVCGCGDKATVEGATGPKPATVGAHSHSDGSHTHDHHETVTLAGSTLDLEVSDGGKGRYVQVERHLLARNNAHAAANRAHFAAHRVLALNLVSSPGAGKTSLLVATAPLLQGTPVAVIEGDQRTSLDADRIRAAGLPAVQINTGKGCHLEADQVGAAFHALHHLEDGFLFIENVGNLVCPASFDLGELYRVVIASVTEGDDKPLKYPDMFASADLMLVSKADIADACGSDIPTLIANARAVKPGLPAIVLSSRTGQGMDRWMAWLNAARALAAASR